MKTLLVFFNIFLVAHVKPSKLTMPSCHVTWFLPMSLALWHLITEGYWDINGRASLQALLSKLVVAMMPGQVGHAVSCLVLRTGKEEQSAGGQIRLHANQIPSSNCCTG